MNFCLLGETEPCKRALFSNSHNQGSMWAHRKYRTLLNDRCNDDGARGWGGGGTDSLGFGYPFENYSPPPFFGHGQPLVLPSPNLQPPLFIETQ